MLTGLLRNSHIIDRRSKYINKSSSTTSLGVILRKLEKEIDKPSNVAENLNLIQDLKGSLVGNMGSSLMVSLISFKSFNVIQVMLRHLPLSSSTVNSVGRILDQWWPEPNFLIMVWFIQAQKASLIHYLSPQLANMLCTSPSKVWFFLLERNNRPRFRSCLPSWGYCPFKFRALGGNT